jgi:cytochrome c-type biogenesis protein CcmH
MNPHSANADLQFAGVAALTLSLCSSRREILPDVMRAAKQIMILMTLCLNIFSSAAFAASGPDRLVDPRLEARAVALQKELRCVQCQSESLDESNAPLAADLRRLIRAHIESGESDARIKNYLVARYGNFILMNPPLEPDTLLLWFGPLIVLALGGIGAGFAISRARARMRQAA